MQIIKIESTEDTPKVTLDATLGKFELSGRSLPEDAAEFYDPILSWLDEYVSNPNNKTTFEVKLEYFNTASSKLILDVLTKLEDLENVIIQWFYYEDDEDMEEAGEEFSELIDVEFELKEF
jgi:hypothetical protein